MSYIGAFKWRGGKSKLAEKIIPYFPEHNCYVEPFFGSGAMFFARKKRSKVECVNDLNGEISNFFRIVREQVDEFCERLPLYPHSRDDFNYIKGLDNEMLSPLDRALRFYILQMGSFSACGDAFANHGASRSNCSYVKKILNIKRISASLDKVTIENQSFETILELYDKYETFFYLDPPYYETYQYAVGSFPVSSYEHIVNFMKSCKGKVALSINDHPFIRELFKNFTFVEFPIKYSCAKDESTETKELLIMNYKVENKILSLF